MTVMDAILNRRNIKQFNPDPIDHDSLLSWLQAASHAPNHRMAEPWEVLVVGPETRVKLNHKTNFGDAPVVLAVLSSPGKTSLERDENVMAVSCFIENFLLAAHESGVGTGISSFGVSAQSREILEVPEGYDVVAMIPVGYPASIPTVKPRTPIAAKIRYLS